MSSPLVSDCIHGNAGLHCPECGLNLNSNDSMKVHNMFSHNQNNAISWRGSTGDLDNNNQPKKIGNTIAAADSSDKQPATPTGPSTSMEHPATPQSYHSAPSPYQQAGVEMQQYSPTPYGNFEYYGLSVESMPIPIPNYPAPEYIKSELNTKYDNKERGTRYLPYHFSGSVSSSTPNNPMLASQPTPSPSPKQCEQCGFLCASEGQLSEHSATVHKTEGGLQQFNYPHSFTIQKESTTAQFLDLDSQRVISKDDSDKKNSAPLIPTTTPTPTLHWPNLPNHSHNMNITHPAQPTTIDPRSFHPQESNKLYMYGQKFASDPKQFPQQSPDVKPFQMDMKSFAPPQDNKAPYQPEKMFQQDGKHFPQPQHTESFDQLDVKLFSDPQKQQIIYHQQNDTKMFSPNAGVVDQKSFPAPVSASVPGAGPGPAQPPLMASPSEFPTTTTPQDPPYRSFESTGPQISSSHTAPTKGAAWKSNEARRPKTYNCTACNKWFTSSGHLKRHYNTTLHKNAVKTSGQPDPATLPISTHHHPGRDPNHPSHKNPQSTSPQAAVQAEPPTRSPEPQGFPAQQHYLPPQSLGFGHPQGYQHIQGYVQTPMGQQPTNLAPPGPSLGAPPGPLHGLSPHPSAMLTQHFVENPPNGQAGPSAINIQQLRGLQITLPPITQSTQILSSYNNHLMDTTLGQDQAMELDPVTMGDFQVIPPHTHTDTDMPIQSYHHTIGDRSHTALPSFAVLQPKCSLDSLTGQDNMQPGVHNTYIQVNHMMLDYQHQDQNQNQQSHSPLSYADPPALAPLSNVFIKNEPMEYIIPDYDAFTPLDNGYGHGALTKVKNLSPPSYDSLQTSPMMNNTSEILTSQTQETPLPKISSPSIDSTEINLQSTAAVLEKLTLRKKSGAYCNLCEQSFNKPCYLTQHNKRHHSGDLPFKCEICGKRFFSLKAKDAHKLRHDPRMKKHPCEKCVKFFNHKTDLTRHMAIHTGLKRFLCEYCERGFVRHDHMVKHGNTHLKKGIVMENGKVTGHCTPIVPIKKNRKYRYKQKEKNKENASSEL